MGLWWLFEKVSRRQEQEAVKKEPNSKPKIPNSREEGKWGKVGSGRKQKKGKQ